MSDVLTLVGQPAAGDAAAVPRKQSRTSPWIGWLLPLLLLVLWQIGASTGLIASRVLPNPIDVWRAGVRLTGTGELFLHIEASALRALAGLLVGGTIGLTFGFANGLSRWSDASTDTSLQMVRNVPHLALIPFVIVWFGIGEEAKLFLVVLGVFFPIYINTLHGIRNVDPQLIEMGRSYGMNGWTLFRRIIVPGALPSIFVGLRYALGITWLTLIVAEMIAADSGIGYMTMQAREFQQTDVIMLGIIIYALLGKAADSSVRLLERTTLSWNVAYRREPRS